MLNAREISTTYHEMTLTLAVFCPLTAWLRGSDGADARA